MSKIRDVIVNHHRPFSLFVMIYVATVGLWWHELGDLRLAMWCSVLSAGIKWTVVKIHHRLFPHPEKPCPRCDAVERVLEESVA